VILGRLLALGGLGRLVARLLRSPLKARWPTTRLTRLHARVLRLARGRIRRSWLFGAGQPVIALTTTGRRSGRPHTTAVRALLRGTPGDRGDELGMPRNPAWSYNLDANPDALITVRGERFRFARGARPARSGSASGSSGCTCSHLARRSPSYPAGGPPIFILERGSTRDRYRVDGCRSGQGSETRKSLRPPARSQGRSYVAAPTGSLGSFWVSWAR
jgi:deazaflavin-dependent oxidoreductase (nitroreductase family)